MTQEKTNSVAPPRWKIFNKCAPNASFTDQHNMEVDKTFQEAMTEIEKKVVHFGFKQRICPSWKMLR